MSGVTSLTRLRKRGFSAALLIAILCTFASSGVAQEGRAALRAAREDIDLGLYEKAQSMLVVLSEAADGDVRSEAWFLLARLESKADEADRFYQRIIDDDPGGDWAKRSFLERAKVQYALGNYDASHSLLADSRACQISDEACLFEGLSANMLERYSVATEPLNRIRRGKHRSWAYLGLAEADAGLGRREEACNRYESLSAAMINPTALYRYAECLENLGDRDGALHEFAEVIARFPGTPEAVLAAEKLELIPERAPAPEASVPVAIARGETFQSGFTIQFGSFRDRGNAIKLATKIKRVFPGVRVDSELVRYREHHRVRYGSFPTRTAAQAVAEKISTEMNEDFTIMSLP